MDRRLLRKVWLVLALATPCDAIEDDKAKPDESWEAVFIGNDKVGYVHTVIQPTTENGEQAVKVEVETFMSIKRFNQATEMRLDFNSVETPAGKLLHMENR